MSEALDAARAALLKRMEAGVQPDVKVESAPCLHPDPRMRLTLADMPKCEPHWPDGIKQQLLLARSKL